MSPDTLDHDDPSRGAVGVGLVALALGCVPTAVLLTHWDAGPRGAFTFADARAWPGLRWFALLSVVGLVPVLLLARRSLDRAERFAARVPGGLALVSALPLVPGALMQATWWLTG